MAIFRTAASDAYSGLGIDPITPSGPAMALARWKYLNITKTKIMVSLTYHHSFIYLPLAAEAGGQ